MLFERIGENAVAVVQGMPQTNGFIVPRQFNTFYYLSGIETPGAYLLLDGRTKRATLYLPARNERLERAEGRVLSADDAELVKRLTGVDEVEPVEAMAADNWPIGAAAAPSRRGRAVPTAMYLRYEDTVVVTEDGVENFTDFLPMELDDIERLVQEQGIVQKVPPPPDNETPTSLIP